MSDDSKSTNGDESLPNESDSGAGNDAGGDAEFDDLADDIEIQQPKPPRAAWMTALLSLTVAALALLGVGWLYVSRPPAAEPFVQDDSAVEALSASVRETRQSVESLNNRLQQLANRESAAQGEAADIENRLRQQLAAYESLPGRLDNLENTISSIQGISSGVRDTWLLAEAEYYMQIANAQLQLASNPHLARLALLQADERISQLANPALTNVRRSLSDELRALELMQRPDIEGITLTLASLASVVDSLPLRQQLDVPENRISAPDDELSGLDRAVESLKSTMSDVVSVRRVDEGVRPFIAPESAYFLRVNLSLQLQAARLALLRSEQDIFQQSLDDAATWLSHYYDGESAQVRSAQQTIAEIRDALFDIETPDISESLRLLRQYNSLAATPLQDDDASSEDEPAL